MPGWPLVAWKADLAPHLGRKAPCPEVKELLPLADVRACALTSREERLQLWEGGQESGVREAGRFVWRFIIIVCSIISGFMKMFSWNL